MRRAASATVSPPPPPSSTTTTPPTPPPPPPPPPTSTVRIHVSPPIYQVQPLERQPPRPRPSLGGVGLRVLGRRLPLRLRAAAQGRHSRRRWSRYAAARSARALTRTTLSSNTPGRAVSHHHHFPTVRSRARRSPPPPSRPTAASSPGATATAAPSATATDSRRAHRGRPGHGNYDGR